jgi:hypothetical protein
MSPLFQRLFGLRRTQPDRDDEGKTRPHTDAREEIADRVQECLHQLGIRSHEVDVGVWIVR